MKKKYIFLLFYFWVIPFGIYAQIKPCKVEIKAENENEVHWAYSDYGTLTYSIYSGILRFEINTWLLSEQLNNTPDLYRMEVLFPSDSFMIRAWAAIPESQLKPQGTKYDYVQNSIPGYVRWGKTEQSIIINYTVFFSNDIDMTLQFSQPSDERLPLYGLENQFVPSDIVIYVKGATINRTPD